jgi:hypothetical protein
MKTNSIELHFKFLSAVVSYMEGLGASLDAMKQEISLVTIYKTFRDWAIA